MTDLHFYPFSALKSESNHVVANIQYNIHQALVHNHINVSVSFDVWDEINEPLVLRSSYESFRALFYHVQNTLGECAH